MGKNSKWCLTNEFECINDHSICKNDENIIRKFKNLNSCIKQRNEINGNFDDDSFDDKNTVKTTPVSQIINKNKDKSTKLSDLNRRKKNIFDMSLRNIFTNMADILINIISDLSDKNNYENIKIFTNIFIKEERLIYFGIFLLLFISFINILF